MKRLATIILSFLLFAVLSGCCITKTLLSGNGNVNTGVVGGELSIEACTPMEKEVANQLKILSDWYRVQWDKCASDPNPATCREGLTKPYNEQKQLLLDLLAAMRGKSESEQRTMYENMLKSGELMFINQM